jgi:hypothetical protein
MVGVLAMSLLGLQSTRHCSALIGDRASAVGSASGRSTPPMMTAPSSRTIHAGRHRSLKLPDALVLATAEQSAADHLITTDRTWPTAKTLKLTVSIQQI